MNDIMEMVERELSAGSRLRAVLVGLAGLGMAGMLSLLLATEPDLPGRTVFAFTVMIAIGLAWVAYGAWVITRRRPLYARDAVVAARMATAFSLLFALVAPVLSGEVVAGGLGLVFTVLAAAALRGATSRGRRLLELRAQLESTTSR